MQCTPSTLFFDIHLWLTPGVVDMYKHRTINVSKENHDCMLFSADCETPIADSFIAFDPNSYYWVDIIIIYVVYTFFVLVGIFSNILNIIIFTKYEIATDSTNSLLRCLAISDLLCLIINGMILGTYFMCLIDVPEALTSFNIMLNYGNIYRHINILSLDFVAIISLQRATAVLLPFKVSTIFSQRNVNIMMAVMTVICLVAFLPVYGSIKPRWVFHLYFEKYVSLGFSYPWGKKLIFDLIYYYLTVHSVACLSIIFISALLTVIKLRLQAESRVSMKAKTKSDAANTTTMTNREVKVVKLSLVLCLITFVTYSFAFLANIVIQLYAVLLTKTPVFIWGLMGMLVGFAINCCFNFFLYFTMSPKFKESVQILLLRKDPNEK